MAEIKYSMKYIHNTYEYRFVILPPEVSKLLPKNRLLSENEWRAIGVQQSLGWVHYAIHTHNPNKMLFRRPLNQAMLAKSGVGEINSRSKSEKFTWTIKNFSKLKSKKLYSEIFLLHETEHLFNARMIDWGFASFIPLGELSDSKRGYIVNDTCIITAEISVSKPEQKNQGDQADSEVDVSAGSAQVCAEPVEHTDNPLPREMFSASFGELMDFRGLGKIEKAFVPLLEEVCSRHRSLIDSQQKRSRRFTEWAFTALGRVLHFLKTKKVKDMNDDTFKYLHFLWEELEVFGFYLTWLEPHVQSALGMKMYIEKAVQVKKRKQNVAALEMEMKRLKTEMSAVEVDIEIARNDLVEVEESFEERDLDAELGYGEP